jgi:hypothetical protein
MSKRRSHMLHVALEFCALRLFRWRRQPSSRALIELWVLRRRRWLMLPVVLELWALRLFNWRRWPSPVLF